MALSSFLFNSDYPMDMITYIYTFNDTVYAGSTYSKTINHEDLGYRPLLFGVWATTEDFSDSRPLGNGAWGMSVESYDTKIVVKGDFSTYRVKTDIYVRIYGFAPMTFTGEAPATQRSSKPLILSTDYAYSPIIFEGAIKPPVNFTQPKIVVANRAFQQLSGEYEMVEVVHDLGYPPSVMLWVDDGTMVKQASAVTFDWWSGATQSPYEFPSAVITNEKVMVECSYGSDPSMRKYTSYIRIYADGD